MTKPTSIYPDEFKKQIELDLPYTEQGLFFQALDDEIPVSIRVHPNKYKDVYPTEKMVWCPYGHYLSSRPIFTLDPRFHAGAYYVQEAASMSIYHILETISSDKKDIKILDLCAAPGGKSTLIATWLEGKGLLVANEVMKNRAYTLKYNIAKEGYGNIIVTNNDPRDFGNIQDFFDIILVDAPCSGEGMFRKDKKSILEWSPENVISCSLRQKRILTDVLPSLKSDGYLIYSTCTYNDVENIQNVDWLCEQYDLKPISFKMLEGWQIQTKCSGKGIGYQFYPHKTKGEGFFFSVLQLDRNNKNKQQIPSKRLPISNIDIPTKSEKDILSQWIIAENILVVKDKMGTFHGINTHIDNDMHTINAKLRVISCGTTLGIINKNIFLPHHELAFSTIVHSNIPRIEMEIHDALLYLKKVLLSVDSNTNGWHVATHQNNGIGFLKNIGNRINNYLPNEYRIIMDLPNVKT